MICPKGLPAMQVALIKTKINALVQQCVIILMLYPIKLRLVPLLLQPVPSLHSPTFSNTCANFSCLMPPPPPF